MSGSAVIIPKTRKASNGALPSAITRTIGKLKAGGGTDLLGAFQLAATQANRMQEEGRDTRILLLTDGHVRNSFPNCLLTFVAQ